MERGIAFGQYEYVDVSFPTANTDVRIRHQLSVAPLTEVYYIAVKLNKAATLFTGTLSLWDSKHLALQSDTANTEATILLFTRNT